MKRSGCPGQWRGAKASVEEAPRRRGDDRKGQLEGFWIRRLLGGNRSAGVDLGRVGGSEALDHAVASSSTGRAVVGPEDRIIGASNDENQNGE